MKLLIKQRVFSWTDSYDIYDENGNAKYCVKAEFLSIGHSLHVYDATGQEIGLIKEKVFTLLPVFEIYISGEYCGLVEKKFNLPQGRCCCHGERPLSWERFVLTKR